MCWHGVRIGGQCFGFPPPVAGETCPNDANGDGACLWRERWYKRCI